YARFSVLPALCWLPDRRPVRRWQWIRRARPAVPNSFRLSERARRPLGRARRWTFHAWPVSDLVAARRVPRLRRTIHRSHPYGRTANARPPALLSEGIAASWECGRRDRVASSRTRENTCDAGAVRARTWAVAPVLRRPGK